MEIHNNQPLLKFLYEHLFYFTKDFRFLILQNIRACDSSATASNETERYRLTINDGQETFNGLLLTKSNSHFVSL
jgi:hypothetical protein